MSRIRIVCKTKPAAHADPADASSPRIEFFPSFEDMRVLFVGDDGTEHPINGVSRVMWSCGRNEEPIALVHFDAGVEIDADAIGVDSTLRPPRGAP